MANLVRIRDVYIYTALNENAADCVEAVNLLKLNNIPFQNIFYGDTDSANAALEPLKTWNWSADGSSYSTKESLSYPLVHWKNVFDDDTSCVNCAVGLTELQNSQLFANLDKVVRPS